MAETCSRCLYDTDHPFGLSIQGGVCTGCRTHEEKDVLDWDERRERLESLLSRRRSARYDCVVPVRGDAEDYHVLDLVLGLGLNPLVTCVNDYFANDIGWHNLHNLITHFDVDSVIHNPDIRHYRELVRVALRRWNHMAWPSLALRSSFPVHVALDRRIPFVVWGQNQAVEQVGKFSHLDEVQMSKWSRTEHDLFGRGVATTVGTGGEVPRRSLHLYRYPDIHALGRSGIRGLYLSNYFRWDPLAQNSGSQSSGFQPQAQTATFDPYERAGDSVYYEVHDLLRLLRTGYRKCRDHLVREIRHGRISRDEALSLESAYTRSRVDLGGFFDWLGVTSSGRDWLLAKRLAPVRHLLSVDAESPPPLPAVLESWVGEGVRPRRSFVTYAKGV